MSNLLYRNDFCQVHNLPYTTANAAGEKVAPWCHKCKQQVDQLTADLLFTNIGFKNAGLVNA